MRPEVIKVHFLSWLLCLLFLLPVKGQFFQQLDKDAFLHVQHLRNSESEKAAGWISASAAPAAMLAPAAVFAAAYLKKDSSRFSGALLVAGSAGLGFGMAKLLKPLLQRPRPYESLPGIQPATPLPDRWSMPSGHSSTAFATAVALCLEYPDRRIVIPCLAWAGSVAFSRILLGHHYPGDVLAGAALGSASAWLTRTLQKKLNARFRRRPYMQKEITRS